MLKIVPLELKSTNESQELAQIFQEMPQIRKKI